MPPRTSVHRPLEPPSSQLAAPGARRGHAPARRCDRGLALRAPLLGNTRDEPRGPRLVVVVPALDHDPDRPLALAVPAHEPVFGIGSEPADQDQGFERRAERGRCRREVEIAAHEANADPEAAAAPSERDRVDPEEGPRLYVTVERDRQGLQFRLEPLELLLGHRGVAR